LRRPEPHLSFRVYPERRAEAGIGEQVKFATKPAKGLAMLERALDAGLPAKWVAADEAYGKDTKFRLGLQRRHVRYVLACNQKIPTESRSSRAVTLAVRAPRSGVETT
jgi:SRSO17 transposase